MALCYPLRVDDERSLPEGFDGPAFIWDIDKTYLSTHFSSMQGMSRIPIEFAVDKQAIPGMPEILRGLRRGPGPGFACAPLYFVTASPPQLRKVLEHKMLLDGVEYDGITYKDWFQTLRKLRPGRLKEQVGFKLCALLEGRQRRPRAKEYLFGDDAEKDAEAFHIYTRLIHGELSAGEAEKNMAAEGVQKDDRRCVLALLERLPRERGSVERIFIHLEKKTPPEHFERFGKIMAPVRGAFQLSLALYELGLIDEETVHYAREAAFSISDPSLPDLEEQIADAVERGLIEAQKAHAIGP